MPVKNAREPVAKSAPIPKSSASAIQLESPDLILSAADLPDLTTGDAVPVLASLKAGSVPLVFADPPFNIGYQYDTYDDARSRADYLKWAAGWVRECARVLTPTGSMFLAIGDEYAAEYKLMMHAAGLHFRNWIIWAYAFGPHQQKKFGRDHAHILYFTKDPVRFIFNADAVRVPSARQEKYGDKRADPRGRVPGDVWEFSRLCGTFTERTGHPCQMPEAILDRIIRAASNPGDVVLDPFAGSGTTLAVARRLGRKGKGVELSGAYAVGIRDRLAAIQVESPLPDQELFG